MLVSLSTPTKASGCFGWQVSKLLTFANVHDGDQVFGIDLIGQVTISVFEQFDAGYLAK